MRLVIAALLLPEATGSGADGAAFRWNHRLSSGFDWWSLRAAARGRLTLERSLKVEE